MSIAPVAIASPGTLKGTLAARLAEARERTLLLIEQLTDEQLNTVYSELLSPLAWDLGHIANFEELWLCQQCGGLEPLDGERGRLYDAIENPRKTRNELPILRGSELRAYMATVRERALEVLDRVDLADPGDRLRHNGFVYELIIAHEHQHNETMLQLLQLVDGYELPFEPEPVAGNDSGPASITIGPGTYEVGAGPEGFAYDNEQPRHQVELAGFEIDREPVTGGQFAEFIAETGAEPPLFWAPDGEGGWLDTRFGRRDPIDAGEPVIHVDWHAADEFARWAGKRLPGELEWEVARERGVLGGFGRVWEWTASEFTGYPGFEAYPYPEYSEVFFGDEYKVLRGGAWSTRRPLIRPSFRNWDLPVRRQIFAGFRCAKDS